MCIILFQAIKKFLCIFSRAIIKCQCKHRTFLCRVIRTIIIEVIIIHTLAYPSGLHVTILIKRIGHSFNILKSICIICTIRILIPFSISIFMPAHCRSSNFVRVRTSLQRLSHRCIRISLRSICLSFHSLTAAASASTYMTGNRNNNSSDHKYNRQNHTHYIKTNLRIMADHHLAFFSAHPLAQNPLIHCFLSPLLSFLFSFITAGNFEKSTYRLNHQI